MSTPPLHLDDTSQDLATAAPAPSGPAWQLLLPRFAPAAAVLGAAVVAGGAALGLWYLPFFAGVVAGVVGKRIRSRFIGSAAVLLLLGPLAWGAVLLVRALAGDTVGGTAHTVAALAGLPPLAATTVVLTLVIALLQAASGAWLGRVLSRRTAPAAAGHGPDGGDG
jgi:hypothetical protein